MNNVWGQLRGNAKELYYIRVRLDIVQCNEKYSEGILSGNALQFYCRHLFVLNPYSRFRGR